MNFKVGDWVKYEEEVYQITDIDASNLLYALSNGFWYVEHELEPITDHDYLMDKILERNNKPEKLNTGDPWIDNLPESYFEMYEEETLKELTESLDLINQHKRICERLNKVYADKNHDYGNSFGETYQKLGAISAVTRISDKTNRLQSLVTKDEQRVDDERLIDTALDLANYAIMFAMELEETE